MRISRSCPGLPASAAIMALVIAPVTARGDPSAPAAPPASLTIPFLNTQGAPVRQLQGSPLVMISVNGGQPVLATVDTGSTTLVVTKDNFPLSANATRLGPGQVFYNSSNITEFGTYYMTDVVIGGLEATATTRVPVLRVYKVQHCESPGTNCTNDPSPAGTAYMGVGFGRGGTQGGTTTTAAYNAFLNITRFNGAAVSPVRGYIMRSSGVTLGLTAAETRGFKRLRLAWNSTLLDWQSPTVQVSITPPTGQSVIGTGGVLTDTGIDHMYLTPPAAVPGHDGCHHCLAWGTSVDILIGGNANPVLYYSVGVDTAGDITAAPRNTAPASIYVEAPATTAKPVFVNTGFHFLNAFSYFYDYDDGYVGYARN